MKKGRRREQLWGATDQTWGELGLVCVTDLVVMSLFGGD